MTDARDLEELRESVRAFAREREVFDERIAKLERENRNLVERFLEVSEENNHLANLFVASGQLHRELDPVRTLAVVVEVMANLVGADRFAVHLLDDAGERLPAAVAEGIPLESLPTPRLGEGPVGRAALVDEPIWREEDAPDDEPLVAIPLRAGERPIGAIAVHRLLRHKAGFSRLDRDLFMLLGGQAATALLAARTCAATSSSPGGSSAVGSTPADSTPADSTREEGR